MVQTVIRLNGESQPGPIIEGFGKQCRQAGLSEQQISEAVAVLRDPLETMIERGQTIAGTNGQFTASRQIRTDQIDVTLKAEYGTRPGLWTRLAAMVRGGQ